MKRWIELITRNREVLLSNKSNLSFCRLPFRMLVRLYATDVAFTPMIYAKHFIASEKCRSAEFTTCPGSVIVMLHLIRFDDFQTVFQLKNRKYLNIKVLK